MKLFSAKQDFKERTLKAIGGRLERVLYVASLRKADGCYEHWGLTKTHGEAAAQAAIRECHSEALLEVLRTPISQLRQELIANPESLASAHVHELRRRIREILPENASKAEALHFSSTLLALDALARARRRSTHRVA